MANEIYLNEEQDKEVSKLPPELITPLISPSGEETYALPQHLDSLVKEGYKPKYGFQKFRVGLSEWGETQDIKGEELQSYLDRGYSLRNPEEWYYEMREGKELDRLANSNYTPSVAQRVAGVAGALSSGITWGLSDVAMRGAFEGLEALGTLDEGKAEELAKTQLKARDDLGLLGTGIEILGGIGTGGVISKLGKTGASAIRLGALEGALAGTTFTAGRDALGDDDIDVESYLWGAGLGGVLGGIGEGVAQGLKKFSRVAPDTLPDIKVDESLLNDIKMTNQGVENLQTIPIINTKNDIVGFADVGVNLQDSYHPIAKTGVSLEGINFSSGVTEAEKRAYTQSFVNRMVADFGSVSSPSKISALENELQDAFSTFGVRRQNENAENYFIITEQSAPSPRKIWMDRYAQFILEKTGKAPEPGSNSYRLFENLFDDRTGLFSREFLEYHNNYEKFLTTASKDIEDVSKSIKNAQKVAQQVREEIISNFDPNKLPDLKIKALDIAKGLDERIKDIRSYNSRDLDGIAGALEKQLLTLKGVVNEKSPVEAYRRFYNAKQDVFNLVNILTSKNEAGKYLSNPSKRALKGLVEEYNAVLKSADLIGDEAAQTFGKLDMYSSKMIKTADEFNKMFKVGNKTQFQRAVKQAFRAREGGEAGKQLMIDQVSSDFKAFADVINEAKSKGFISNVDNIESATSRKALNNIGKIREFQELSNLMRKMKGDTAASGAGTAAAASTGSVIGSSLVSAFGPLGGAMGALLASSGIRTAINPEWLLKASLSQDKGLSKFRKAMQSAVDGTIKSRVLNRQAVATTIGLTSNNLKTPTDYVEAVRNRIAQMRETTQEIYGSLGDQLIEDAIKRKTDKTLAYVQKELPVRPKEIKLNSVDARKVDKLLVAAFKPQEALQSALLEGDTEMLTHLKEMYPTMLQLGQKIVSEEAEETSKVYKTMVRNNVRKASVRASQSVFVNSKDKSGISTKNMTIPEMPMGASIQDA